MYVVLLTVSVDIGALKLSSKLSLYVSFCVIKLNLVVGWANHVPGRLACKCIPNIGDSSTKLRQF